MGRGGGEGGRLPMYFTLISSKADGEDAESGAPTSRSIDMLLNKVLALVSSPLIPSYIA